jgi:glycosyltransferase involved in cell wall biosynthesis
MRLGVYADLVYRRDGEATYTDRAFILFVVGMASRLDELVLFGRVAPEPGRAPYELPAEVRVVPFPYYRRATDLAAVVRSLRGARRAFIRELDELDAVWIFGPYPVSFLLALLALRRGKPVFLGTRQDFPEYIRNRLPGARWRWAVGVAQVFEAAWKRLSRRAPAVVVGDALGASYAAAGGRVLPVGFSLIRDADLVTPEEAERRPWEGELRIVSVGRLDREKNPLLLAEILAELRARDPRWRLTAVGTGPLAGALRERAAELGVGDALELAGYVAAGPELWAHYRRANVFLHVSLTEGLPQVLFEAFAAGTPVVATDVGGVRAALADGAAGLLVPAANAGLAAAAVERLRDEPALRRELVEAGFARVRGETMDAALDRIAAFFADQAGDQPSARARRVRANSSS